jgi:hypothetical protein
MATHPSTAAALIDSLLDIKRLAEKSGDAETDPFALLDIIAADARAALASAIRKQKPETCLRQHDITADLLSSLRDMLSRFRSCIAGGNGEIEGDKEAIEKALMLLSSCSG